MGEPHADTEFATHGPRVRYAYLLMFGSAAAFASMSACAHALGGRCDWRLVLVTRGGLVWLFAFLIARRGRNAHRHLDRDRLRPRGRGVYRRRHARAAPAP